jgi:mono/diheme cytochrome c family protein
MLKSVHHWLLATACSAAGLLFQPADAEAAAPDDPAAVQFFDKEVRPLLETHCLKCHGAEDKIKGGLRLTSREDALKGGDLGSVLNLERPHESILLRAIGFGDDKLQMPPKGKLPPEAIATLTKWVEMGLPFSPGSLATAKAGDAHEKPRTIDEAKSFWSFQPLKRPDVPQVKRGDWVRNPIDAFILQKLEAKGFGPAPSATKIQLLRRAYYDLTGLPPTPADVQAYLADASSDAYEKVIDRLLASPHYGEKWGRHWLDLVRFAETNSYERDNPKPNAWRYRDYVIKSFNDDKPYDRFLKEQLAGDEMPEAKTSSDPVIATGYYRLGIWDDEPTDPIQSRYDALDDIVATTGQVMLGLTIDCARCHDHKIDPIPQKDYYKLLAFFHNINHFKNGGPTDEAPVVADGGREAFEQRMTELAQQRKQTQSLIEEAELNFKQLLEGQPGREPVVLADLPDLIRKEGSRVLGAERYKQYLQLRRKLRESHLPEGMGTALAVTEAGPKAPETFVLIRGSAHAKGQKVEPGFPEVLGGTAPPAIPEPPAGSRTSARRTVLADWIASPENRLTARVMANRLFQYHFGRGIVRSPNNFGLQGDAPTHPELLDWLASEFIARGWKMKAMHRLIMTSSAYRMASTGGDATALAADPRNDLMWRFDLRRLTAEEMRDSVLALNGTLNTKLYGPSVYPPIPREVMAGQSVPGKGWETSGPEDAARRSVYVHVKRSLRLPILESFDAAEPDTSCPVRFVTVQPTQALGTLNSEFMNQEADKLAKRLKREAGEDMRKQVALAMRLVTSREPTEKDVARGVELIESMTKKDGATPDVALKYFCLLALNLNEFVYLD